MWSYQHVAAPPRLCQQHDQQLVGVGGEAAGVRLYTLQESLACSRGSGLEEAQGDKLLNQHGQQREAGAGQGTGLRQLQRAGQHLDAAQHVLFARIGERAWSVGTWVPVSCWGE